MNSRLIPGAETRRLLISACWVMLLMAVWYAGISKWTDTAIQRFEQHTSIDPTRPDAPDHWRSQRFFADPDSYYWLAYARDLRRGDSLRIRYTYADNAPYGREVHWAQPLIWIAAGLSKGFESVLDVPEWQALELAGRTLGPLLGWASFTLLFVMLQSRLGPGIAGLLTGMFVILLHWEFHTLRPDHHGLHLAAALGMWIALLFGGMGWVQKSESDQDGSAIPPRWGAHRWFIAAGLAGALGLWLGATVFLFSLAAASIAACLSLTTFPSHEKNNPFVLAPNLWRLWAITGAVISLVFYAIEYAPAHMAMRLEVNHPLYALCWLGIGELLRIVSLWKAQSNQLRGAQILLGLCALVAAGILPMLIILGPVEWFLPRTEIMLRLHAHHISEFKTLFETAGSTWFWTFLKSFGATLVAAGMAVLLLLRYRLPAEHRILLLSLGIIAFCFTGLYILQVRWEPFALGSALLLSAVVLHLSSIQGFKPWSRLLLGLLLLHNVVGITSIVVPLSQLHRVEKIDSVWLNAKLQRNLMLQIREHLQHDLPLRLMVSPEMAPAVYYFNIGDSIASLYWENVDGVKDASLFFGTRIPGDAAKVVGRSRSVTRTFIRGGAGEALMFYNLLTGSLDQEGAAITIGGALAQSGAAVPDWLQVDTVANEWVRPIYYTFAPNLGQYVPLHLNVSVHSLHLDD
jgi:hypothetical protein